MKYKSKLDELHAHREKSIQENKQRYGDASKERLGNIIRQKLQTTFIGALSECEEQFGFLWGYNSNGHMTEEQEEFKDLWDKVRTNILNNGNSQLRALEQELEQYNISWKRHTINLQISEDN